MQKWEYLFVTTGYKPDNEKSRWLPRRANDRELPDWEKGQTISQYTNQLGEQGWELVAATVSDTSYGSPHIYEYVFKRPKP